MSAGTLFAMSVTKPLVEKIGRKLLKRYQTDSAIGALLGDLIPTEADLVGGISQLIRERKLDDALGRITEADELTDVILDRITSKIRELQEDSGTRLEPDGILGRMTLRWIRERRNCGALEKEHYPPVAGPPVEKNSSGRHVIRYFIEEEIGADGKKAFRLPKLGANASTDLSLHILSIAFESWFMFLNLEVSQTGDPTNANLIITTDILPPGSPDNFLALTQIGPPNGQQLRLTLDRTETWSREVFQATVAHEFGHALGIRHRDVRQPNQLMNDTLSNILEPQSHDIAAARDKGWGSR